MADLLQPPDTWVDECGATLTRARQGRRGENPEERAVNREAFLARLNVA